MNTEQEFNKLARQKYSEMAEQSNEQDQTSRCECCCLI